MKTGVIYVVTNVLNGKQYVGQTTQKFESRKQKHLFAARTPQHPDKSYLHHAIAKYGEQNFQWEVLCEADAAHLDELEELTIEVNDTLRPGGYNVRAGNSGKTGVKTSGYRRQRPEDEGLPAHICVHRVKGVARGYQASHLRTGRQRVVISTRFTMTEKLEIAKAWLAEMDEHGKVSQTPHITRRNPRDDGLPPGIYYKQSNNSIKAGYEVNVRGHSRKMFMGGETLSDCLNSALAYHATLV